MIGCAPVRYDQQQSLQTITLLLTNNAAKPVQRIRFRLLYFDGPGKRLRDWTTERELDRGLQPNQQMELSQPAYFMPNITRRVAVEVKRIRFADGTEWSAP